MSLIVMVYYSAYYSNQLILSVVLFCRVDKNAEKSESCTFSVAHGGCSDVNDHKATNIQFIKLEIVQSYVVRRCLN